jgi:hypothetical protein
MWDSFVELIRLTFSPSPMSVAAGAMILGPRPQGAMGASNTLVLALLGVGGTLFFLWSASSAVALSLGAGSLVSGLQSWILGRDRKAPAPSA